jgi:Fe2+ transport system protein B
MKRRDDGVLVHIFGIVIIILFVYAMIQIVRNVSYSLLFEDLVEETVEEIVEKRCVLK